MIADPPGLPVIQLVGPTASGKSGLAVDLALGLREVGRPAEIVNADSMLVYRGMDIGTAKPTLAERRGVEHHLIDLLEVTEQASVAQFQQWARATISDLRARQIIPILVGGSALYSRAITDVFEFPGTDPIVRARWEQELAARGSESLHEELSRRDPDAAADILPGNGRRVVRALELLDLGLPVRPSLPTWTYAVPDVRTAGLSLERDVMDARIDARVDAMWAEGLVDEVRGLLDRGLREGRTASRAIGYHQVIDLLDGLIGEDEARQQVKQATRRFARKQLGWYRRDHRIVWLSAESADPAQVLDALAIGVAS